MIFLDKYSNFIQGIISCYDRIVIQGNIPGFNFAEGMTSFLKSNGIRIFDYAKQFAEPLRDIITENTKNLAAVNEIEVEYIQRKNFRKEERIKGILNKRGAHPGLVHIFSALEPCSQYKPWHDKKTGKTYLRGSNGKCLHYYFYFIDEDLGLMYVRVPTWCPFRLQIYFNGHNLLAMKLRKKGIGYDLLENAFVRIENFNEAQKLSDNFNIRWLHKKLDKFARLYCPVIKQFPQVYYWSIWQVEYATDIVFHKQTDLASIYENLIRTAIHTVKPEQIATFLGRKFHGKYQGEMGNDFSTRIEGTRLRHSMGKSSIKMYDKFKIILRIETTTYDVTFFKHFRKVVNRNGEECLKNASMKKEIYSLTPLRELLLAANKRYLEFISSLDDNSMGMKKLTKVSETVKEKNHSYKGINFFNEDDITLMRVIASGEFCISGFQSKNLKKKINKTNGQISRLLRRLRLHGLIKKIGRTYKYYITELGRQIILAGLKLRELFLIPELSQG